MKTWWQWSVLALCGALALSSCVLINRFDKMEANVNPAGVSFTLPGAKANQKIILGGIDVWAVNCERDCAYWELVRPASAADTKQQTTTLPIHYGVAMPDMQTRVHKPLVAGTYRVTAGLVILHDNGKSESVKVIGGFTIQ